MSYRVLVDENFHSGQRSHGYALGDFATYAEAFAACKEIVDGFLRHEYVPGMPASALYVRYMMFGREARLVGAADNAEMQPGFSSWDYARERCSDLCEATPLAADRDVA